MQENENQCSLLNLNFLFQYLFQNESLILVIIIAQNVNQGLVVREKLDLRLSMGWDLTSRFAFYITASLFISKR
jgi:hypothetical protein